MKPRPLPRGAAQQRRRLLEAGSVIVSPESGLRYRIADLIVQGGYGQVYVATRVGRSKTVPRTVCIKVSPHIDGWLREAYFGQLLNKHPRVIRVYDTFPLASAEPGSRKPTPMLYCLAIELAHHGDLSAHLYRTGKPFSEAGARREIAGILQVLGKLHRGQLLHRDLTPLNVFVCNQRRLKLGDFGIVRQQSDARGITARTLNRLTAPLEIVVGAVPKWQARDDVYQVGQLLGMLVKGDALSRIGTGEIRHLPCGEHLKEIIHRCIGERRKRYENADDLIDALRNPPAPLRSSRTLRDLRGVHLTFTGILSKPRREAIRAARKAGAIVHSGPSARTSVVVRGRANPQQAAGRNAGLKLMEVKRLRAKGQKIKLLAESQFWKLVEG